MSEENIIKYEGDYDNNKFNGRGKAVWGKASFLGGGATYNGNFKDGVMHGEGVLNWGDDEYSGQFKKNIPDGMLTKTRGSNGIKETGLFKGKFDMECT